MGKAGHVTVLEEMDKKTTIYKKKEEVMENLMEKFAKANINFIEKANQSNLTLVELSQAWVGGWTR